MLTFNFLQVTEGKNSGLFLEIAGKFSEEDNVSSVFIGSCCCNWNKRT